MNGLFIEYPIIYATYISLGDFCPSPSVQIHGLQKQSLLTLREIFREET